jgi:hypothetical protein
MWGVAGREPLQALEIECAVMAWSLHCLKGGTTNQMTASTPDCDVTLPEDHGHV